MEQHLEWKKGLGDEEDYNDWKEFFEQQRIDGTAYVPPQDINIPGNINNKILKTCSINLSTFPSGNNFAISRPAKCARFDIPFEKTS